MRKTANRALRSCVAVAGAIACLAVAAHGEVVINEIYYNPGPNEDATVEFVELVNAGDAAVDCTGWRFADGIEYTLPNSARIEAGGYLVVCRNRARFLAAFALPGEGVLGEFAGRLDDNGERLVLRDAADRIVDVLEYHDLAPWPEDADGLGASLQRRCPDAPGGLGASWIGAAPTPRAPTLAEGPCPPLYTPPTVALSEIHYHPLGDRDADEEFVEIVNRGAAPVDLSGWQLRGAMYTFNDGTVLDGGASLVVCRNEAVARARFGIENTVGNFAGSLSNDSERIALYDANGSCLDAVFYGSAGQWPAAPDGNGFSLERISLEAPAEDPANWSASLPGAFDGFLEASGSGTKLFPGGRLLVLYLEGEGTCIVDGIVVEDTANPGTNLMPNGDFNAGLVGWTIRTGVHGTSAWTPDQGVGGSGALRLTALTDCGASCSSIDAVYAKTLPLTSSATYRLTMKFKHVRGSVRVVADIDGKVVARSNPSGVHSAGRVNAVASSRVPPMLEGLGRVPREPSDQDDVVITARVRGEVASASLHVLTAAGTVAAALPMFDDGAHADGGAGDRTWGVRLGRQAPGAIVWYVVVLAAPDGTEARYPRPHELSPCFGYYVSAGSVQSPLPLYQLFLPELTDPSPENVNAYLSCDWYRIGHFACEGDAYPNVAVRLRGNTSCRMEKSYLKVRFNHGAYFHGLRKLNLNSLWTDKAQVREYLAWEFVRRSGAPTCATEYVRLHLNGAYFGLYLYVEHPDGRFLERNGLDGNGLLYKAEMGPYDPGDECGFTPGVSTYTPRARYEAYWEQETNQDGDFTPLGDFIDTLHEEQGALAFFQERVDPESIILFELGQVGLRNYDSATKNHFLLRDARTGLWNLLPWDLDLSFGKYFRRDAAGPNPGEVGTLNDYMSCAPGRLMPLDFAATMIPACEKPANWLLYYFLNAGNGYYRRAYLVRLWDFLQETMTRANLDPEIERLCTLLRDEEAEDLATWGRYPSNIPPDKNPPPPEMLPNIEIMQQQFDCHRDELLAQFPADIRVHPRLRITEIMAVPEDAEELLEFVELLNPDAAAVAAGGWSIDALGYAFPAGTIVPPGGVVVVARDPAAFQRRYGTAAYGPYAVPLDNGGAVLRVYDAGQEASYPAVVDRVAYGNGGEDTWPEPWRGYSIELAAPEEPLVDNARPEQWARSAARGGTPGRFGDVRFTRGDIDQNGTVQIGDAVGILGYLFAGKPAPACLDGADVNDDDRVNLADAIRLLGYLFASGPAPAQPFGACGLEAGTALGCGRFTPCGE